MQRVVRSLMDANRRYTVVYDGDCGVCTALATRLAALDERAVFEIVPSQQQGVQARFPWIPATAYAEALQLVRNSDGRTWQGAAAIEEIVGMLRGGWLVSWIFMMPCGRRTADRLYRWFAGHRHELGCGEPCETHVAASDADA